MITETPRVDRQPQVQMYVTRCGCRMHLTFVQFTWNASNEEMIIIKTLVPEQENGVNMGINMACVPLHRQLAYQ